MLKVIGVSHLAIHGRIGYKKSTIITTCSGSRTLPTLKFSAQINRMTNWLGTTISWLTLLMVVTMTLVVVLRYGFNLGWIWLQESVLYMHAAVVMLAMSYTLQQDKHVRVDVFYRNFSKPKQNKVNLFGHLFFLIPTCLFVLFMSWGYVTQSWSILEGSQEAGGLPLLFLLKSLLIAMPVLLIFQAISEVLTLVLDKGEQA